MNNSATIQPFREASPKLPDGDPLINESLYRTRGKTNTGGNALPTAFTMPTNVTNSPRSADTICPIWRFPRSART